MALLPSNKHRSREFKYKPLFYDKRKEELEELKKKYENPQEYSVERLRQTLQQRWQRKEHPKGLLTAGRSILYLAVVAFMIYYLYKIFML